MSDQHPDPANGHHRGAGIVDRLLADGGASNLADGEWHRVHPLTPLFKGGLVFLVVVGILIANMRDRLIFLAIGLFTPSELRDQVEQEMQYGVDDPISWALEWTFGNNLFVLVSLAMLAVVAVVVFGFWAVWRFQQFRVTGENVEVKKGIVFRSQRRAPLDRIQGINLTRPFPARLFGMAKLTLEGAGTGADVALEYLGTKKAEQVRRDILNLASGVRQEKERQRAGESYTAPATLGGTVSEGVSGLIGGVDQDDVEPDSVVRIPVGRLLGSHALTGALWIIGIAVVAAAIMIPIIAVQDGPDRWIVLIGALISTGVPLAIAAIALVGSALQRGFRYSIAPTPDGVRVSNGLLTTVTRTLPPGRIHAVEVTQSLLWRPFGWWSVRINRMGGVNVSAQSSSAAQAAAIVLPVGTRADAERVVRLLLPDAPAGDVLFTWEHGMLGPHDNDPFTTVARRARVWHPIAWRRLGIRVTSFALLMRRGRLSRRLALFPLARMQGVSLRQGPIARSQDVAAIRIHTVPGPISGEISGFDRADAQRLSDLATRGAVAAAEADHSHRWAEYAPSQPAVTP
ncbi:PH domain-containing protein [Microbacterium amylolyticum]|uniref:Membrane protein n=1 Tax=Microbacterium amylolyticum TaxID=936337 RepID=A0ABS4ZGI1_9MICO|nr:PH domain-containing protein [Microbacterium amylolyticum]MBP2436385.1 putative membrane protein [Microbacterium amylolyticum]